MRLPLVVVVLFVVLVTTAKPQTEVPDRVRSAAALEVEPSRADFVCVLAGEDSVRAITWRNTGVTAVTIFEFVTTPPFVAPSDRDVVLQPGGSITRDLHYVPLVTGTHAAFLTARTSNGDVAIPLSGRTSVEPTLEIMPTIVEFNQVAVGDEATLCIAIHNPSCRPALISSVRFDLEPWVFSVSSGPRDMVVDGFERDTICVRFRPTFAGGVGDILRIRSTDGSEGTVSVTGMGVEVDLRVALALDFGAVVLGGQRELPLTISNNGDIPVRVTAPPTFSGVDAADFEVTGLRLPATIARGIPLTLRVVFTPGALGDRNAAMTIANSSSSAPVVALHGMGSTSQIVVTPDSIDMGDVLVGLDRTAPRIIVIGNRGATTVRLDTLVITGRDSSNFGLNGFVIAPIAGRDSLTLDLRFAPTAAREFLARADGKLNDGTRFSIPLRGRGVLPEPPKDRVIWADTSTARVGVRQRVRVRIVPPYSPQDSVGTLSMTLRVDPRSVYPHGVIAPAGRTASMVYSLDGRIAVTLRAADSAIHGTELFALEYEGLSTGVAENRIVVDSLRAIPDRGALDGVDGLIVLTGCDVATVEVARISAVAVKEQTLRVRVTGADIGAWCRLLGTDGRELARWNVGEGESTSSLALHAIPSSYVFLELRSGGRIDMHPIVILR